MLSIRLLGRQGRMQGAHAPLLTWPALFIHPSQCSGAEPQSST